MTMYPDFVMYLGSVGFRDMEVPEQIEGILEQAAVVHDYPGGARTVDAMGPRRGKVTFSGILMDEGAESRRNELEALAADGLPVTLAYASRVLLVLVTNCRTMFHKFWQINYTIELDIVDDLVQPLPDFSLSDEDAIESDLNEALNDAVVIADTALTVALTLLRLGPSAIISYALASVKELAIQVAAIGVTQTLAKGAGLLAEAGLAGSSLPALFVSGADAGVAALAVTSLASATMVLPSALDCANRLGRAGKNVSNIGA